MGEDSNKNLVGQPIFKQIIKMVPRDRFEVLVRKCRSDNKKQIFVFLSIFAIFVR